MGVDLTLLPVQFETDTGDLVCVHAFDLHLNSMVMPFWDMPSQVAVGLVSWPFEKMDAAMRSHRAPDLPIVGGPRQDAVFGEAIEDERPRDVLAGVVADVFAPLAELLADANDVERAAIAYVSALDRHTKIVLRAW